MVWVLHLDFIRPFKGFVHGVDNSAREKHGALLDSELLAEVYLELVGGRQPDFALAISSNAGTMEDGQAWRPGPRDKPLAPRITEEERAAHEAFVENLGDQAVWRKFG